MSVILISLPGLSLHVHNVLRVKNIKAIKNPQHCAGFSEYGGEGGIRTPGRDEPTSDFKSGALNRALPPLRIEGRMLMMFIFVVKPLFKFLF